MVDIPALGVLEAHITGSGMEAGAGDAEVEEGLERAGV